MQTAMALAILTACLAGRLVDADTRLCSFSMPSGTFDLAPLGTVRALSKSNQHTLGWLFAFNVCENLKMSEIAGHCAGKAPAPAVAAGTRPWCRVLGRLDMRSIKHYVQHSTAQGLGLIVSFEGGDEIIDAGDDSCGSFARKITITILCSDNNRSLVKLWEDSTRPCSYIVIIESRVGCPLACARDPTGSVCGGADRGVCKTTIKNDTASCVCLPRHSGTLCTPDADPNAAYGKLQFVDLLSKIFLAIAAAAAFLFFGHSSWSIKILPSFCYASLAQPPASTVVYARGLLALVCGVIFLIINLFDWLPPLGFRTRNLTQKRPSATCAFTSAGSTFRFGGSDTLVDGAFESYEDQLAATRSHAALLQSMWENHGLVCDIFFITYNNAYVSDLREIFENTWPHRLALFRILETKVGFLGLYDQVLEAALPIANLNSTRYEVLHFFRADLRLKPYFTRLFDPLDADRTLFASLINSQQSSTTDRRGYGKGRPWINEMAMSMPRKHFPFARPGNAVLRGQELLGHGTLNWFMDLVPWNEIGTMVPTYHFGATHYDWNPMWDIVGRGSVSNWHPLNAGLCVSPHTFEPIPVGAECANKSAYEAFIVACLGRSSKRPCLCACSQR